MSSDGFYRAFEERYRGPRELIRERLKVYLPFIEPLRQFYQPAVALDVGCGRGEWLELLQEAGFRPQGVDLDEGMLQACIDRGLPVLRRDGIEHLQSLDDESQSIVSGFHVAEHISFNDLNVLVVQALRVLKPGGLLILETPNPENLVVGSNNFYLDPSHIRPIPPLLLSFIPEYHGFAKVRIIRLQEAAELRGLGGVRLMDVLGGASPDYAVVAQKGAPAVFFEQFDVAFAAPHGIELHELADRYDEKLEGRFSSMEQRLLNAEIQQSNLSDLLERELTMAQRFIESLESRAQLAEDRFTDAAARLQQAEFRGQGWERQSLEMQQQLQMVYASFSWRALAPLRKIAQIFKRFER